MENQLEPFLHVALVLFIAGSLLEMGLRVPLHDAVAALGDWRFTTATVLLAFVACPALAIALTWIVPLEQSHAAGLVLLAMAPAAPFLPAVAARAGGAPAYVATTIAGAALASRWLARDDDRLGGSMTRHPLFVLLIVGLLVRPALGQDAPGAVEPPDPALFDEPDLLTAAFDFAARRFTSEGKGGRDEGFYPKVGGMISGAGWIAAGPGYRWGLFDGHAFADAHAAVSWRGYLKVNAVLEFPSLADGRLATGVEGLWQNATQVNYFGLGIDSSEDLHGQYRLQTTNVVTYARYRPQGWLAVSSRVGWLARPSVSSPTGPFKPNDALDAQATFPGDPAMTIPEQPRFLHGEMAITADTRDFPDHPTHGSLYHASAGAYVADERRYSFQRYEVEGLHTLSLFDRRVVLLLRGWGLFTHALPAQEVPFYLMPSLGGSYTLRGYSNYRFHDRHLLLASIESRWPIFEHLDGAVFVDAGTVAAQVGDLGFDRTDYGFGLRLHTQRSTIARLDVAHTAEGWHVLFRSSDPFNLDRLKRWTAAVPFVP